jgi:hypothetical protein
MPEGSRGFNPRTRAHKDRVAERRLHGRCGPSGKRRSATCSACVRLRGLKPPATGKHRSAMGTPNPLVALSRHGICTDPGWFLNLCPCWKIGGPGVNSRRRARVLELFVDTERDQDLVEEFPQEINLTDQDQVVDRRSVGNDGRHRASRPSKPEEPGEFFARERDEGVVPLEKRFGLVEQGPAARSPAHAIAFPAGSPQERGAPTPVVHPPRHREAVCGRSRLVFLRTIAWVRSYQLAKG